MVVQFSLVVMSSGTDYKVGPPYVEGVGTEISFEDVPLTISAMAMENLNQRMMEMLYQ